MANNCYAAGKNHGTTTAGMGKKSNSTGVKVNASAGQSSGTRRMGDKSGTPVMGKGK